jgi:hypothetical protein
MQRCPRSVKCIDATYGISGDVYNISIVLFCTYANHIYVSHTARTNYGDECELPPTIRMPSIFGELFIFVEECIGPPCCMPSYNHISSGS